MPSDNRAILMPAIRTDLERREELIATILNRTGLSPDQHQQFVKNAGLDKMSIRELRNFLNSPAISPVGLA